MDKRRESICVVSFFTLRLMKRRTAMSRVRRKKTKKIRNEEEDEDEEEEDELDVRREGSTIFFYAPVTRRSVLRLAMELRKATREARLETTSKRRRVTLFLQSDGGDLYAGLSAMDHVRSNPVPVTTVADGFVASSATCILLGGHVRKIMPHTNVLIHQLSMGFWGKYRELLDEVQNSKALMAILWKVYSERTNLTKKTLRRLLKSELTLSADECLREGMVDSVYGWKAGRVGTV